MAMIRKDFHQENYKHLTADERVLTPKEKLANWWYYHKWHVVLAVVLLCCLANILKSALHIGEIKPDYLVAYVGSASLPSDTAALLQTMLEEAGEDLNHDGQVLVEIRQYVSNEGAGSDSAYYQYASEVTLLADLDACESFFFLLEDPRDFERDYGALAYIDGSLPADSASDYENMYIAWKDSPLLGSWEMGTYETETLGMKVSGSSDALLQKLSIARRGFWAEKTCDNVEGCEELWNIICGKNQEV